MFKLVVLFALVAVAIAKPGLIAGHLGYSAVAAPLAVAAAPIAVAHSVAVPAAVSSTYRRDVVSSPIVAAHAAAPIIAAPALVAPVAYAAHVPSIHAW